MLLSNSETARIEMLYFFLNKLDSHFQREFFLRCNILFFKQKANKVCTVPLKFPVWYDGNKLLSHRKNEWSTGY